MYDDRWHRGVIKSVKPDFQVTVSKKKKKSLKKKMNNKKNLKVSFLLIVIIYFQQILFIDYGTVKTYPSDNICYLFKKFARLPVQAIPCGLFNIRPHVGDRWSSTANKYFCDKVSGHLLAATVHSIDTAVIIFISNIVTILFTKDGSKFLSFV